MKLVNDFLIVLVTISSIVTVAIIIVPLVYLFAPLAKYQARILEQRQRLQHSTDATPEGRFP
ncbi:MAG: hypothetical protein HWQ38_37895 [Nostoc sp. NMS7]|uniref:hypothetical protein n=1 Tax=Nostoc sp. NMS7 TaxID=2815391 RepID=UPI0025E692C2|nr:hypothetical protein [Nostoc sp. NMS7]MBN3951931.1 hypothetical protein [Nostoc sp. NMS7]